MTCFKGIAVVVIARIVATAFEIHDLFGGETEEEKILGAELFADFDVRPVERADG